MLPCLHSQVASDVKILWYYRGTGVYNVSSLAPDRTEQQDDY